MLNMLGMSETDRKGTEEQILNGYKFIGQGTEEGRCRSGVGGLLLGATAQKALEGYNSSLLIELSQQVFVP